MALHIQSATIGSIATDTGSSATDFNTNDPTLTVSGTVATNGSGSASLGVYLIGGTFGTGNGTLVGSVTITGDGAWSFDLTTSSNVSAQSLVDGTYTIRIADGTTQLATHSLTVDTSNAPPGTPDLDGGSDSGASNTDDITNVTTPTVTGTADVGATVTLYDTDGTTVLGTGTADGGGNWSIISSALSEGDHTLTATQADLAGNVSAASSPLTITIDITPPVAAPSAPDLDAASDTGTSSTDDLTNVTTPTVTGTGAEAGATVTLYDTDGTTVLGTGAADGSGNWSITSVSLGEGTHSLTATQMDVAGNESAASDLLSVTIDTSLPAAPGAPDLVAASDTGASSTDDLTKDTTPTVTGIGAEAGATVTLHDTDGTTVLGTGTADGSGNWSITNSVLVSGVHTLSATETDIAGNVSATASAGLSVTIDTVADLAPLASVSIDDSSIDNTEVHSVPFTVAGLDGDATGNVTFTSSGGGTPVTVHVTADGSSSADLSGLNGGTVTASLAITDTAGNTANGSGDTASLTTPQAAVVGGPFLSTGVIGDANGDSSSDWVQVASNGHALVLKSNGSSFDPAEDWNPTDGSTSSDRSADVNGDGNADQVQIYHGRVVVALSSGGDFGSWADWGTGATDSDKLADVNNDGNADLVQFYNGRELVALSNGANAFGSWSDWVSGATANDKLADVNGDGNVDLVQFYNGRELVALSNGANSFGSWTDWASGVSSTAQLGDVNGDGSADLVDISGSGAGSISVRLSNGASSFGSATTWGTGGTTSDKLGDFNGDGNADLLQVVHHASGDQAEVALSNGATAFGAWQVWA